MTPGSLDFSLHALEARFEMQGGDEFIADPDDGGGGGGGGGSYDYYGDSWDDYGYGEGYVGVYEVASDDSGAMLDDGSFTDGSDGIFPSYQDPEICRIRPDWPGCPPPGTISRCRICRC
jgi:hypothetical protein